MLPLYQNPPKSIKEYKTRIIDLITKGWCKNNYAIDKNGRHVDSYSPVAECICLRGAFDRASGGNISGAMTDFTKQVERMIENNHPAYSLGSFNDLPSTTKGKVLELIRSV